MQVGVAEDGEHAMAVISVSEKLEDSLLQELCEVGAVESAIQIVM